MLKRLHMRQFLADIGLVTSCTEHLSVKHSHKETEGMI
jgi:hypothetical protein